MSNVTHQPTSFLHPHYVSAHPESVIDYLENIGEMSGGARATIISVWPQSPATRKTAAESTRDYRRFLDVEGQKSYDYDEPKEG